jgi:hypothetical protein
MQLTERRPEVSYSFQLTSALASDVLFDLLADPQGCLSWHAHPKGMQMRSVDAAPGAALAGAEIVTEGTIRGVPFVCRTRVVLAERPSVYATASEMAFPGRAVKNVGSTERYVLESGSVGTLVNYTVTATRELQGVPYLWPFLKIYDRFFGSTAVRRCFVDFIAAAERHVNGVGA